MRGLTKEQVNLIFVAALAVGAVWVYRKSGAFVKAGQQAFKPLTDPIGKALAELRYGEAGSGVQATDSYIVLRARDFNSFGIMSESAYTAASRMHSQNVLILQRVLTTGRQLKQPYLNALKQNDAIIITLDREIHFL